MGQFLREEHAMYFSACLSICMALISLISLILPACQSNFSVQLLPSSGPTNSISALPHWPHPMSIEIPLPLSLAHPLPLGPQINQLLNQRWWIKSNIWVRSVTNYIFLTLDFLNIKHAAFKKKHKIHVFSYPQSTSWSLKPLWQDLPGRVERAVMTTEPSAPISDCISLVKIRRQL